MGKATAHIRYKNKAGDIVPGVTTVLGILNKPALVPWANKIGLQGIEVGKYVDDKAEIGTLAHAMIEAYLKGEEADTSDYSKNQIEQAENSLLSFWEWAKNKVLTPILLEKPLVSECGYGGTIDCYCILDNVPTLLDFKTGKALYKEATIQVCSYKHLLNEHGHDVRGVRILRIGREESEGFEEKIINDTETGWQIFVRCLDIYKLLKVLSREGEV